MIGLSGLQRERMEKKARSGNRSTYDHPNNGPDKISHPATASPDSRSASQIEFATQVDGDN
jgi:hypothetical protein